MADPLSAQARSALMGRVRTRDTRPERLLRSALWELGVRGWRLHPRAVPGRPDLAWIGRRVAVFVDGAFWHGHPDYYRGQSGAFWDDKIATNRARDERVNHALRDAAWIVVRIWDFEIERDAPAAARRVAAALTGRPRARAPGGTDETTGARRGSKQGEATEAR
jgi:DNA mismatch endonuclease (patch repair protein)